MLSLNCKSISIIYSVASSSVCGGFRMELQYIALKQYGIGFMKCLSIVLLPCIVKWSSLQDLLIWLLVIFPSGVTWNSRFLSTLHAICRINEIEYRLNWKIWGKSQVWYAILLEVWKKRHEFLFESMAGMSNKNLQKQLVLYPADFLFIFVCHFLFFD